MVDANGADATATGDEVGDRVDVVVVGAGMAGLYLLHRLRGLGLSARVFEAGSDVGGTWFWNRYPGARCDIQSVDYSYSFDPELDESWTWSEKYATQAEILSYLQHVADRHDLRRDISFDTRVASARWDEASSRWSITTDAGDTVSARYYVMATGCLSQPKDIDIPGADRFGGATYSTSRWPHDGADLDGKRVAVIGTGSSGIQSIPLIAARASELTVFQRTPNFSIPARNGPIPQDKLDAVGAGRAAYRQEAKWTRGGVPGPVPTEGAFQVDDAERARRFEEAWEKGELAAALGSFNDLLVDEASNETFCEFIREKIRSIVDDPETAESLCPSDHPFGTKRPCLDSGYYETFNHDHVSLVDLRKTPITTITETGIETTGGTVEVDVIVYATGFDAMTGAIVAVDITGRDGLSLAEKWDDGPRTYLGLTVAGFPNFFTVTGPGSPSVLSNMAVSIEQHVDWIADCIGRLDDDGYEVIEATSEAEAGWVQFVNDAGDITLYPKANSWYMGANVPGKPRVFLPFVGGVDAYRATCDEVMARDYIGFELTGDGKHRRDITLVRPLQPDVTAVLAMMAELDLPSFDSMSPQDARAFSEASSAARPPGPEVGEIVDGVLPGADGNLDYRLYRPQSTGPHPVVVYFHGGGWVLGSHDSDDPFCRYLCDAGDVIVVSVDYRHAPEHRFPAAADDATAGLAWVAEHASSLGGDGSPVVVCGWSAGANVAAVACQQARDTGGPAIAGQVLITPVTDCDADRGSFDRNGEGYILTASMMGWFWDHYCDPADRSDPRASPLRAESLADLPPTLVVTAEFDPLRDEGEAYANAMADAGVAVRHIDARGQIHTSFASVGMILSADGTRAAIAEAIRGFVGTPTAV